MINNEYINTINADNSPIKADNTPIKTKSANTLQVISKDKL